MQSSKEQQGDKRKPSQVNNANNNIMGKTRDLFKKIRDTKGKFRGKKGMKGQTGIDPTEAEHTKKSLQEYTEELYKKDLHDPDNHDGVITYLEQHPGV